MYLRSLYDPFASECLVDFSLEEFTSVDGGDAFFLPFLQSQHKLEDLAYESWGKYKKYGNRNNAKKEWDSLKRHFINEYGLAVYESPKGLKFYLKSRLTPDAEKARQNVTQHITRAIKDIENKIPSLADHFKKHIEKGRKCLYRSDPDNPIDIRWQK